MTIRKRLTFWYTLVLVFSIAIFSVLTVAVMRTNMIGRIDENLRDIEATIRLQTRILRSQGVENPIQIDLPQIDLFHTHGIYIQAWIKKPDERGFHLTDTSSNISDFEAALSPRALGTTVTEISSTTFEDLEIRVLTEPLVGQDGNVYGYLQLGSDLSEVNASTENVLFAMVVASGFAIMGAGIFSMWFAHRTLIPIKDITEAAASIAITDDLRTRLEWAGSQDEVGRLVSVFNQMMSRIEHLFSVQQRFSADVSHELRTPLTTIMGNIEFMQRYGPDSESINAINHESGRMKRLVDDLLFLARADYGGENIILSPIDLDRVVLETFENVEKALENRDLKIYLKQFQPVRIMGNADWLNRLLANLISNAIKFTSDGGEIRLGLEHIDDRAVMWVQDTGCGIADEDQVSIFERFYRGDPARRDDGGSFGLGLAIAKWIAQAHKGEIRVQSELKMGTTFIVDFPILDTTSAPQKPPHDRRAERTLQTTLRRITQRAQEPREPDPPHISDKFYRN